MDRVNEAAKRLELVYCEIEPGHAMVVHPKLLHRSDQNRYDKSWWSLICCYNAARNDPYKQAQHPRYTPLTTVDDVAIKRVEVTVLTTTQEQGRGYHPKRFPQECLECDGRA